MDEQQGATQGAQATSAQTTQTGAGQAPPPTIEDQMAKINSAVEDLKRAVEGDEGDAGAGLAELGARVDAVEKDLAAHKEDLATFKQQLHDAGIRLVS